MLHSSKELTRIRPRAQPVALAVLRFRQRGVRRQCRPSRPSCAGLRQWRVAHEWPPGVVVPQLLHQDGQVFAGVLAGAQEHGHHGDMGCACLYQACHRLCQWRLAQFQIGANHRARWVVCLDARSHGLNGGAPERVARAVRKRTTAEVGSVMDVESKNWRAKMGCAWLAPQH